MSEYSDDLSASKGPISQYLSAKNYLESNKVPEMFRSLISCLMLERPDDCLNYLTAKLDEIKDKGLEQVDWETFIQHMHPEKYPVRVEMIGNPGDQHNRVQAKNEIQPFANLGPRDQYKSQLFQLTQPQE
ncbi:hypothetical protein CAPTEDRAFT_208689 [Capitella teleta]|uniref:Uncharacterized protein n=1 Tax=Capitella teleta TaxID=283909 RepID=R7TPC3_CAPTE|nr:hypothetical protein CAPTEDRAFT_208689 [Capitella teleta]|eukprot:ELT95412.1 hypothetical protein CAPTEDRAFT_208689 [Capitella teleta]